MEVFSEIEKEIDHDIQAAENYHKKKYATWAMFNIIHMKRKFLKKIEDKYPE